MSSTDHVHLLSTGEAGISQKESEDALSRLIPGLPEAVYICGTDQSTGSPETPQHPLSYQNSGQQPRVQVRLLLIWIRVCRLNRHNFTCVLF